MSRLAWTVTEDTPVIVATDQRALGPDGLFWRLIPASTGEQWCRTCPDIPHRVEHPGLLCPACEGTEAPL